MPSWGWGWGVSHRLLRHSLYPKLSSTFPTKYVPLPGSASPDNWLTFLQNVQSQLLRNICNIFPLSLPWGASLFIHSFLSVAFATGFLLAVVSFPWWFSYSNHLWSLFSMVHLTQSCQISAIQLHPVKMCSLNCGIQGSFFTSLWLSFAWR